MRRTFLVALLALTGTLAQAQPVDKTKTAKEYVSAGLAAQKAGDYDTALTFYGKAYELVPHPVLVFNMAQANRLAGRIDKAIELYKKYLESSPQGPQAKVAADFVAEHDAQLAAEAKRKAELDEAAATRDREEQARKADIARKQQEAHDAQVRQQQAAGSQQHDQIAIQPRVTMSDDGRPLRITGYALAGTGVVATGVGVLFGLHARNLSNELSAQGAVYDPQKVSDGHAANRNMIISTVVGGALIAGGVVVYIVGSRRQSSDHVSIAPLLLERGGGVALGGSL